ncbi:MAG: AraC family transcriptional regulator [Verrucomicrobia bacterium]|nr:AraC family transcriptional regulator [Verrucomicrobiota bacterium]
MQRRTPVFHATGTKYRADTCAPLVAAAAAGAVRLVALARGAYPGGPLPGKVLPQVCSIGYWDAAHDQIWGLGEHRNEGLEITYLGNGHLGFVVDGRAHPLAPGQLTITRPWQPHSVGDPKVAASRLYWLILDVGVRQPHQAWSWPPWLVLSKDDLKDLTALLRENEHPVWPGTPEIGRCFAALGHLVESAQAGTPPTSRLALLINELLVCVLELLRTQNPPRRASLTFGERSVAMFLERLHHELDEPWTLETMATQAGLKRTRFAHHCRKLTNLAPMAYLQQLRVEQAKHLLTGSQRSITAIALDCGFASSAYFSSVFRRFTGCAPRGWREQARNGTNKPAASFPRRSSLRSIVPLNRVRSASVSHAPHT